MWNGLWRGCRRAAPTGEAESDDDVFAHNAHNTNRRGRRRVACWRLAKCLRARVADADASVVTACIVTRWLIGVDGLAGVDRFGVMLDASLRSLYFQQMPGGLELTDGTRRSLHTTAGMRALEKYLHLYGRSYLTPACCLGDARRSDTSSVYSSGPSACRCMRCRWDSMPCLRCHFSQKVGTETVPDWSVPTSVSVRGEWSLESPGPGSPGRPTARGTRFCHLRVSWPGFF